MCEPGKPCPGAEDNTGDNLSPDAKAGIINAIMSALFGAAQKPKQEKELTNGGKIAAMLALMEIRRRTSQLVRDKQEREAKGITLSAESEHELVKEILALMKLAKTLRDAVGETDAQKEAGDAAFKKVIAAALIARGQGIKANDPTREDFMRKATNTPENTHKVISAMQDLLYSNKGPNGTGHTEAENEFKAKMHEFGILSDTDVVVNLDRVPGDNDGICIYLEDGNEIELILFDFGEGKFALLGSTSKAKEKA